MAIHDPTAPLPVPHGDQDPQPIAEVVSTVPDSPKPMRRKPIVVARQSYEPTTSTDEWLLTYGDMVTLLLTLFVLLVLTATYDPGKGEGKGEQPLLSGIFTAVSQFRVESPYADDILARTDGEEVTATLPQGTSVTVLKEADMELIERREQALEDMRNALVMQKLDPYVSAIAEGDGVRLEIPNSILFDPGKVELLGRGRSVLRALAPVLAKGDFTISVEGHTDSSPIDTLEYASNWELSANRAARVVRLLIDEGIAPTRLEAVGFADTRPLAKNDTPDGRAENRRVTILVRTGKPSGGP
jgi:chemotaxis protein MotB